MNCACLHLLVLTHSIIVMAQLIYCRYSLNIFSFGYGWSVTLAERLLLVF